MSKFTVKQARSLTGYSQEKMAKVLGISKNAYIRKEVGSSKFYVDEAYMFSEIVGLPMQDIIFFKDYVPKIRNT